MKTRSRQPIRHCVKPLVFTLFAAMVLLSACRKDSAYEISNGLEKAEAKLSDKKEDDALAILLKLEHKIDGTVPDTLKYKVLSRIGSVYYADFKKDKADAYFKQALVVARRCGNEHLSGALWNRCLTIASNDSIPVLLKECMDVSRECGFRYAEVMAGINLANAYARSGDHARALEILDNMREKIGDDKVLKAEFSTALQNYLVTDKQFDKAIEMLDRQKESDLNIFGKLSRFQNYYAIELASERYLKALEYRDSIDRIKNEIDSIGDDEKLSKIESESLLKLSKEREYRNIAVIIALSVITLLVFFLFGGIKRRRMMKKQLELNGQISKLNLRIAQLTETHDEMSALSIEGKANVEAELIEKLRLNRELFMSLPIYGRLKRLNLKRDSEAIDKAAAKEVLDGVIGQFADVCSNLRKLYAGMTYDDVLYCSAIYVGFTKEVASVAFGSSEDALRRRKSRIKQKLPIAIFEAIFGTKV